MSQTLTLLLSEVEAKKTVTDEDVSALRSALFADGTISLSEADTLFRISDIATEKSEAFGDVFVEAITSFLVRQTLPYGYVDEANASWLISRISHDGHVETMTELRTLVNIIKTATDSSDRLVAFALAQVVGAVKHGQGVIGRGRKLEAGRITAIDVELLRTIIYACGGDRHIAVTRREAEALFDLNDACRGADNAPEWTDLFVKAIANYLMYLTTFDAPTRDEALRRDKWLDSRGDVSIGSMIKRLKFKDMLSAFAGDDELNEALESQRAEAARTSMARKTEEIDADEAAWLSSRIGRDGDFDDNERALIAFLKAESPYLHVTLQPLLFAA